MVVFWPFISIIHFDPRSCSLWMKYISHIYCFRFNKLGIYYKDKATTRKRVLILLHTFYSVDELEPQLWLKTFPCTLTRPPSLFTVSQIKKDCATSSLFNIHHWCQTNPRSINGLREHICPLNEMHQWDSSMRSKEINMKQIATINTFATLPFRL